MMFYLTRAGRRFPWWRILLLTVAALILAATFMAYFSAGVLVDFANLRLC